MLISRFLQRRFVDLVNTNSFFDEVSKLHPLNRDPWEEETGDNGILWQFSAISSYLFPFCPCGLQVSGLTAHNWANVNLWVFRSLLAFFALEFLIRYTRSVISTSWKACLWEKMLLIWLSDSKAWVQIVIALNSYTYFPFVSICIDGNIHKVIECQAFEVI